MRKFLVMVALVAAAGLAATASAQEVREYGGPLEQNLVIPDGPTMDAGPVLVPGAPANAVQTTITVPDSGAGPILDVNVTLGLHHSWYGDLNIYLTHGGTTVTLKDGLPDDSSNLGSAAGVAALYTLDDEAGGTWDAAAVAAPLTSTFITAGAHRPNGTEATAPANPFPSLLSAFDGMDKQGDWVLSIDDTFLADTGFLSHFSLQITNVPEPATLGLLVVGAVSLIRRRR